MHPILKNIIFDLGGVLLDLDMERCFNAFEQAGLTDVRRWLTGTNELGFFSDCAAGWQRPSPTRKQTGYGTPCWSASLKKSRHCWRS